MDSNQIRDVVIIGGGPAGLSASIYCSCFHLSHTLIGQTLGGQIELAPDIMNYPGFLEVTGKELASRMIEQAKTRGAELVEDLAIKVEKVDEGFVVTTKSNNVFSCHALILATGTERKKLNVPGEIEYTSKGVHYCATCERQDYAGKIVAVVGGANSAAQSAVQLSQAALKVYILYRGEQLRADPIWLEQIEKHPNIQVYVHTQVKEIVGDGKSVTSIKITSQGSETILSLEKVFIEIGGVPGTALVAPLGLALDLGGFVHVDDKLATSISGIFAAGDLISYGLSIEQIASAVGLGARAAASTFAYIRKVKAPSTWGHTLIKR